MKPPFEVNEKVIDDLTGKKHTVIGISYSHGYVDGDKHCNNCHCWGIWIDSDWLDGARHPWELSKMKYGLSEGREENAN